MKMRNVTFVRSVLALSAVCFCATLPGEPGIPALALDPAESTTNVLTRLVGAGDPSFHYEGRIDFSDSNAPVIIWQASRISLDFEGPAVRLDFDDAKGQNYFNAQVDGSNTIVTADEGVPVRPSILETSGPGRHHLVLYKRSEANAGTVRFRGVMIAAGADVWAPKPSNYRVAMEFIGDSITVGACNEDGPEDQWDSRRTHNCALSYATLTADAFDADYQNIAVSGMGVATGWVPMLAGQVWNRLYPDSNSPAVNLGAWIPNVIFVNFGENDGSYPAAHGQGFPTNFTANYVALIHSIRAGYPKAHIVLLRGGMFNGARNVALRKAWESAVADLESGDHGISHFVFKHWTSKHPRVIDDRIMAGELIWWLKQQSFMRSYVRPAWPRAVSLENDPGAVRGSRIQMATAN